LLVGGENINNTSPRLHAALLSRSSSGWQDRVAVVADRRLSLAALTALLLADEGRELRLSVSGRDVAAAVESFRPAVCVLDLSAESWAASPVRFAEPSRLLLLLDPDESAKTFVDAIRSGAGSFLAKSASREVLESALERVARAGTFLDPMLAGSIWKASEQGRWQPSELSPRESEILGYVASGHSSKQIARQVGVTAKTVCNHVSNIYTKLNLRHRGELVLYAAQQGLETV
jgi:DNA-binding NarL/FixJ family response regulator